MKRFAIDIVLIPPDNVIDLAIDFNRTLLHDYPSDRILNRTNRLPHVSLLMGCLAADQLQRAKTILQSVADRHGYLNLQVTNTHTVKTAGGSSLSLDIDPDSKIVALHESIVSAFSSLLTQDATSKDLNDDPPIEASSIEWINSYISEHSLKGFWPHITIGPGSNIQQFKPFSFQANRLAICHLGNHCTCTKVLEETFLRNATG